MNDTILNEILVLEATQEYLHKHLKNTAQITYENDNIYFDQILLLQSIDSFNIIQSGTLFTIQLCTNNQVCQTWKIDGQKFE
ncbi:MAG: hypothetical protein IE909_06855 [Campylobacterales bacterium]|nr:hypothetical protein [Campylobacterales bacterium]